MRTQFEPDYRAAAAAVVQANTYADPMSSGPLPAEPTYLERVRAAVTGTAAASYTDLIAGIIDARPEGCDSARDLPELAHEDLALVLRRYPTMALDAFAEADPDVGAMLAERLGDTGKTVSERYSHVGLCVVGCLRAYAKFLVLRDVQALHERNRQLDSLEGPLEVVA